MRLGLWISIAFLSIAVLFCGLVSVLLFLGAIYLALFEHSLEGFAVFGVFSLMYGLSGASWFLFLGELIYWARFTRRGP